MKVVATKIPDDVYEELKEKAKEEGSIATLLRKLIYQYLEVQEGKPEVNLEVNLREEIEELKKRVEELEKAMKRLSGIGWYMRRK